MKLIKEQKEKLIGKKIVVDRILVKENVIINHYSGLREIETVKLKNPVKAIIIGFTFLCEGKINYIDPEVGSEFICTKRIPCIKIASGITGKIQYAPMSIIEKTNKK